jgi:hypothetical protein
MQPSVLGSPSRLVTAPAEELLLTPIVRGKYAAMMRSFNSFAQRLEVLSGRRGNGAAEAVQNIALEKSPGVFLQVLRPGGCGKSGDSLDRWAREFLALMRQWFRYYFLIRFRRSANIHVRPSSPLALPQNT